MKIFIYVLTMIMVFGIASCSQPNNVKEEKATALNIRYFGTAGWEFNDGEVVLDVDPYLSRVRLGNRGSKTGDDRKVYERTDFIESDSLLIDSIIGSPEYILLTHTHFDHICDIPYIAKKTGAKIIGSQTTCNFLRSYGIPDDQLYEVFGGEDYQFETFSVKVVPSLHSALRDKHYFDPRRYTEPLEAPLRINQCIEGGTFMYYIRFKSHKVLIAGGMNYIEKEVQGLEPDILMPGVNGSKNHIYKYTENLLKATNYPTVILPTHWDSWSLPYGASQEKAYERNIKPFIQEVADVTDKCEVIVPEHLKPFSIK